MPYPRDVVTAIVDYAKAKGFIPDFLLSLVAGESSLNVYAENPAGWYGAIQINIAAHGPPKEKWLGIDGMIRSFDVMLARWVGVLWQVPNAGEWWNSDPVGMLSHVWPAMQGADPVGTAQQAPRAVAEGKQAWSEYQSYNVTQPPKPPGVSVPKPSIQWFPADERNYSVGRQAGVFLECIVIHTTDGGRDIESLGTWFGGENIRQGIGPSSTHFGVGLDGRIGQYVSLNNTAFAHGVVAKPTAKLVMDNTGINPNSWAVGIEHLDNDVPGYVTDVQLEKSAQLAAWIWTSEIAPNAAKTGAVIDRDHIIGHWQIDAVNRAHCPSWSEDRMNAYIQRVKQIVESGVVAPPAPPPAPPPPAPPPAPPDNRFDINSVEDLRRALIEALEFTSTTFDRAASAEQMVASQSEQIAADKEVRANLIGALSVERDVHKMRESQFTNLAAEEAQRALSADAALHGLPPPM